MNDVFVLSAVSDDLVAPRDLEGLFGCAFGVFCEIPLCGERKSGVELFDACEFVDLFDHFPVFFLQFFDGLSVRSQSVGFEEVDLCLVEGDVLLLFFLLSHLNYFQMSIRKYLC